MPNFHAHALVPFATPHQEGDVTFLWEARSDKESLVLTQVENHRFFIKHLQKEKGVLVKGEKITRPSQVKLLQRGLIAYEQATRAQVRFSNIYSKKNHHETPSPYLKPPAFFANNGGEKREIWVEVGFGSGRHLLHQAKANPEVLVVGIEIHKPSVEQVIKRIGHEGVENVYVVDYDARILMEFLPASSVGKIFVHFPVPWDKKPHRRVISPAFVEEALRVLKPEGTLELRTDSDAYYAYAVEVFTALAKTKVHIQKNIDLAVSSKYEDRWKRMEKNIYDVTLVNLQHATPAPPLGLLTFKETLAPARLSQKPSDVTLRGEEWFVHVEGRYALGTQSIMLKVAFGAYDRPEHRYVLVESTGKASYFPEEVFSTKANTKAHAALQEWMSSELCH